MTHCYSYYSALLRVEIHVHVWLDFAVRCTCDTRSLWLDLQRQLPEV